MQEDYPYLFQTCGFSKVDEIRAELESQREWDHASCEETAHTYQKNAASRFGFFPPFTQEQEALADYLLTKRAGQHMCTYAWGLYADSAQGDEAQTSYHYA